MVFVSFMIGCLMDIIMNDMFVFTIFLIAISLAYLYAQFSWLIGGTLNYVMCIVSCLTSLVSGAYLYSWYAFENVVGCLLLIAVCLLVGFILFKLAMVETATCPTMGKKYRDSKKKINSNRDECERFTNGHERVRRVGKTNSMN